MSLIFSYDLIDFFFNNNFLVKNIAILTYFYILIWSELVKYISICIVAKDVNLL